MGIEHDTRRVHFLGMDVSLDDEFMARVARRLTENDGILQNRPKLVIDNENIYTKQFCEIIDDADAEIIRTAIMAPNRNPYIERFFRSLKEECLDHFVFLNEQMLLRAVTQYIDHYNNCRPHQSREQRTINEWTHADNTGNIVVDERLGGLLKSARRLAA